MSDPVPDIPYRKNPPLRAYTADIVDRYQRGESVNDIAKAFGVSKKPVYDILDREGIPKHGNKGKIEHDEPDIIARYQRGETGPFIASQYDITPATVYAVLRRNNVLIRDPGRPAQILSPSWERPGFQNATPAMLYGKLLNGQIGDLNRLGTFFPKDDPDAIRKAIVKKGIELLPHDRRSPKLPPTLRKIEQGDPNA